MDVVNDTKGLLLILICERRMKRTRSEKVLQQVLARNARKESRLQYAYDEQGRRQFHGAFEGGHVKECENVVVTDEFEGKAFIPQRDARTRTAESNAMTIGDIVDEDDGVDWSRREAEVQKMVDRGMSFAEARRLLRDIGWDGEEEIVVSRSRDNKRWNISFGRGKEEAVGATEEPAHGQTVAFDACVGGDHGDRLRMDEEQLKKRLNGLQITTQFNDRKKQMRYERYLEGLASGNAFVPEGLSAEEWQAERYEFVGKALASTMVNKGDMAHHTFLQGFIEEQKERSGTSPPSMQQGTCRTIREITVPPVVKRLFGIE